MALKHSLAAAPHHLCSAPPPTPFLPKGKYFSADWCIHIIVAVEAGEEGDCTQADALMQQKQPVVQALAVSPRCDRLTARPPSLVIPALGGFCKRTLWLDNYCGIVACCAAVCGAGHMLALFKCPYPNLAQLHWLPQLGSWCGLMAVIAVTNYSCLLLVAWPS